jgi:hypothetical protein
MFPTGKLSHTAIAVVPLDAPVKLVVRNVLNDLSENSLSAVHVQAPFDRVDEAWGPHWKNSNRLDRHLPVTH